MEKKSIVNLFMGTFSGVLFAIGMCMSMVPLFHLQLAGIVIGSIGLLIGLMQLIVHRWIANGGRFKLTFKSVLVGLFSVIALIVFGAGMVMTMVWGTFLLGVGVGILGMVMLLSLNPMFKNSNRSKA